MLQTFSLQSMFRDLRPTDVANIARQIRCCATGQSVKPSEWYAIVKDGGQLNFCLPDHVNGRQTLVPTRELVERITPGFGKLELTVIDRYALSTTKRKRAQRGVGV